jgi:hypothetical protein
MYSGLVLTKYSGRLIGAHQKIDRVARRHLGELLPAAHTFPSIKSILQFEGKNGPDGIKRKSPGRDEPWHFIDPLSDNHQAFLNILDEHFNKLVNFLKTQNQERAAFEAAWLAHAIVDGLTPAHHYPYEEKISEMRGGESKESRTSIAQKLLLKSDTTTKTVLNTLKAYGPKGIYASHTLFELGVSVLIRPLRLPDARPEKTDMNELKSKGYEAYFIHRAREIAVHNFYEHYLKTGWTPRLSNRIRHILAPTIVRTVTMLWFAAAYEAGLCES